MDDHTGHLMEQEGVLLSLVQAAAVLVTPIQAFSMPLKFQSTLSPGNLFPFFPFHFLKLMLALNPKFYQREQGPRRDENLNSTTKYSSFEHSTLSICSSLEMKHPEGF